MGVYAIANLVTGQFYIGSSGDIGARFHAHVLELKRSCHFNRNLQAAWNQYGEDSFSLKILEEVDKEHLLIREVHHIANAGAGAYNQQLPVGNRGPLSEATKAKLRAAQLGRKATPDTVEKMRAAHLGKRGAIMSQTTKATLLAYHLGRELTPETKARIAISNRGKKRTSEHRARISAANRGRKKNVTWGAAISAALKGRSRAPFTAEHRARIAAARRGTKSSPETIEKLRLAWRRRRNNENDPIVRTTI